MGGCKQLIEKVSDFVIDPAHQPTEKVEYDLFKS